MILATLPELVPRFEKSLAARGLRALRAVTRATQPAGILGDNKDLHDGQESMGGFDAQDTRGAFVVNRQA